MGDRTLGWELLILLQNDTPALTQVQDLLARGADTEIWSEISPHYYRPLSRAVQMGRADIVVALLDAGAQIDARDFYGRTALLTATSCGRTEIVGLLLDKGARETTRDESGTTALGHAVRGCHVDILALLLEKRESLGEIDRADILGFTPLMQAARADKTGAMARMLLEKGAAPDVRNTAYDCSPTRRGATALIYASSVNNAAVARMLAQNGADINARDSAGNTALIYAAMTGSAAAVTVLLEAGARTEDRNIGGETAEETARRHGHHALAAVLDAIVLERATRGFREGIPGAIVPPAPLRPPLRKSLSLPGGRRLG